MFYYVIGKSSNNDESYASTNGIIIMHLVVEYVRSLPAPCLNIRPWILNGCSF